MTFDGITIAYYAAICGALASIAPRVRSGMGRIATGAAVGILAATLLPAVRASVGL